MVGFAKAGKRGCQHGAHRAGIGRTVGMPADLAVDRAGVEAAAAPDAAQDVPGGTAEKTGPAVVHQHDMEGIRPVGVAVASGTGGKGRV